MDCSNARSRVFQLYKLGRILDEECKSCRPLHILNEWNELGKRFSLTVEKHRTRKQTDHTQTTNRALSVK